MVPFGDDSVFVYGIIEREPFPRKGLLVRESGVVRQKRDWEDRPY